ncbi:MAG: molybdopterin-dependent oxidoreductase, partial [Oceanococcaceae bacterium]
MSQGASTSAAGTEIRFGACNLCEAICGLEFHLRDGEIQAIKGDAEDPLSRGHICPKAVALKDIYNDPDRLRRPLRRRGEDWEEIDWDTALDEVADRLVAIREAHGPNAIGAYLGNPSVHNYGTLTHSGQFLGPLKTRNRFSATSVDQLPHQLVALWMYGHQLLVPISDIDHCQFFLVLGANPMASNGSLMTVPDFRQRLKDLQARGGRMVVIDPRRTETAAVADAHHFIRPGTDAALLAALLNTLFEEGLAQPGRLAAFTEGLDAVREAIRPFSAEKAAEVTGIAADSIRQLARDFAAADGAACYGRMGVSTQAYGGLCQWLIQLINIATGNLDRPGGVLFTRPAVDLIGGPRSRPGHYNRWRSRVSQLPEFGGELPASTMAEEISTPGEDQIRAMVTIAGNPVLSTPNGRQLDAALEQLDFMVSVDLYLNETTRHADIILPPTSGLEHDHYDLIFHIFAVRNTARYSPALFDKPEGAMHDWEIFNALGERINARLGNT